MAAQAVPKTHQLLVKKAAGASNILLTTSRPSVTPLLVAPAVGATLVSLTPTLSWTPVLGATSYQVTVLNALGTIDSEIDVGNRSSVQLASALSPESVYYWQVTAKNCLGAGPISGEGMFQTR